MPGYARVKVSHRTIDWDRDTMPGFVDFEIRIERELPGDKRLVANSFDVWARCSPVMFNPFSPGHWACRHNPGRCGFYTWEGTKPGKPTVWLKDGLLPQDGREQVLGGDRLGAIWQVKSPPGLAGGTDAWGWVRMTVNVLPRLPRGNWANINWADPAAWTGFYNVPCEGLAAILSVDTSFLPPGLYKVETFDNTLVEKTYLRHITQFGPAEHTLIHHPGYLYLRHPSWDGEISRIVPVDPDNPFDPIPVTPDDLQQ